MGGCGMPFSPTLAQIGSSGRQAKTRVRHRNTPQDTRVESTIHSI